MRLYGITAQQVESALFDPDGAPRLESDRLVVLKLTPEAFGGMPLKVIYIMEMDRIIVLSAYPLKRAYRR